MISTPALAQLQDEVIVTATKRAETASDIPITITALGEDTLDELNVDVFTDPFATICHDMTGYCGDS